MIEAGTSKARFVPPRGEMGSKSIHELNGSRNSHCCKTLFNSGTVGVYHDLQSRFAHDHESTTNKVMEVACNARRALADEIHLREALIGLLPTTEGVGVTMPCNSTLAVESYSAQNWHYHRQLWL